MAQSSIESFFLKRKRSAIDDYPTKSKVLVLGQQTEKNATLQLEKELGSNGQKIIYQNNVQEFTLKNTLNTPENKRSVNLIQNPFLKFPKPKNTQGKSDKKIVKKSAAPAGHLPNQKTLDSFMTKLNVPFELKGELSPRKKLSTFCKPKDVPQAATTTSSKTSSSEKTENARKELGLAAPRPFQHSNLNDIKNKLCRSSRISELREKLANKKNMQKFVELDKVKLQEFAPIDFEFHISPSKAAYQSPIKTIPPSPKKSPFKSPIKSPAFQRFSSYIQPFSTGLILPRKHGFLLEIFQCTDIVASMFFNRNETITFSKLKTGVQEMIRRNFTEQHLGQIQKVMPNFYKFTYEKSKKFIQSNSSKYELVIIPVLMVKDNNNVEERRMGTKILEERRTSFENALITDVKKHHTTYLLSLEPALILSQDSINRWHSSFDIDSVREISPNALPSPPDSIDRRACSAKDILEKAKNVLACNSRMTRALEEIASSTKTSTPTMTETDTAAKEATAKQAIALEAKYKGIPPALLERVRARQAAKAKHEMTCTTVEAQETIRYSRLPEIARYTRAIFVSEKKNVLPFEQVVIKLGDSIRENLTRPERETHLRLLIDSAPGWITQITFSNTMYIRLNKQASLAKIISDLEQLAKRKRNPSI